MELIDALREYMEDTDSVVERRKKIPRRRVTLAKGMVVLYRFTNVEGDDVITMSSTTAKSNIALPVARRNRSYWGWWCPIDLENIVDRVLRHNR